VTITNKVSLKSVNGGNTPIPDVPDAPTVGTVTNSSFDGSVTVAATAAATGGTPTSFVITPTPTTSPATFTGTSPVTVTGLSDGVSYTFTATGVNATATGPASAASSSFNEVISGSYTSIATVNVASSQSSVTFSSIPSTYTHLQVRYIAKRNDAYTVISGGVQLNSDTGTNYTRHELYGDGASALTSYATGQTAIGTLLYTGTSANASNFGTGIIDILDYANTNKYKTLRLICGADANGSGQIDFSSGLWLSTAAVNTITFAVGSNFVNGTQFALYGVK
jgi:hypothetical protein